MAYAKVNNGNVEKTGKIFDLLPEVSNPTKLSQAELEEKNVYRINTPNKDKKSWQTLSHGSVYYDETDDKVYQEVTVENIGLEEYKKTKLDEIKGTLPQIINEGFTASNGIKIDVKSGDRSNWMNTLHLLDMTGGTQTEIRDFNNVTHVLSYNEYKTMVQEAGGYVQKQFQDKWLLQNEINSATTHEDVEAIYWRKPVYDENEEFVKWEYNSLVSEKNGGD